MRQGLEPCRSELARATRARWRFDASHMRGRMATDGCMWGNLHGIQIPLRKARARVMPTHQWGDLLMTRVTDSRIAPVGRSVHRPLGRPGGGTTATGAGGAALTRRARVKGVPIWCPESTRSKTAARKSGAKRVRSESARKMRQIPREPRTGLRRASCRPPRTNSNTPCVSRPPSRSKRTWRELRHRPHRLRGDLRQSPSQKRGHVTRARAQALAEPAAAARPTPRNRRELVGEAGVGLGRRRTTMQRRWRELPGHRGTRGAPRGGHGPAGAGEAAGPGESCEESGASCSCGVRARGGFGAVARGVAPASRR